MSQAEQSTPSELQAIALETRRLRRRINVLLWFFIVALVLSGITAFPLATEADLLQRVAGEGSSVATAWPEMAQWLSRVHQGITDTNMRYPFMSYGTDWLAFAHIVIAIAFIGPLRDPVKNLWVVEFGIIACILVIPLALICGPIRGIPVFWRLIDCSFGLVGVVPLWFTRKYIRRLAELNTAPS